MSDSDTAILAPFGHEMTIGGAAACREALIDALCATDGDLRLDLSDVAEVDSSAIQLLLSARRSMAERGAALHIVATSPAVQAALAVFGLEDLLADTTHKE